MIGLFFGESDFPKEILKKIKKNKINIIAFGLIAIRTPYNIPHVINKIFENLNFKTIKAYIAAIKKVAKPVSVIRIKFI